jgi:hypothetical protein
MDFLPHSGSLLTVAEDDAVLLWKLSNSNHTEMPASLKGLRGTVHNKKKKINSIQKTCKLKQRKPNVSKK